LAEVRLWVASTDAGPTDGQVLPVSMEGLAELPPSQGLSSYAITLHPFQALFNLERSAVFRPSWSPSGDRLVFSDGLRLLMWSVDGDDPAPIPSTEDGVHAAWSPDGEWIAFTRLVRGEPVAFECLHTVPLGPVCRQERVEVPIERRVVTVVRPDGSDVTDVGPGDDPAWLPDSQTLVFRRQGRLWTVGRDGSGAAEVPGTEGGREPAASPDGAAVVFARIDPRFMTHDLWVVSLTEGGP
jgi:Tol biopolymer transport system component